MALCETNLNEGQTGEPPFLQNDILRCVDYLNIYICEKVQYTSFYMGWGHDLFSSCHDV